MTTFDAAAKTRLTAEVAATQAALTKLAADIAGLTPDVPVPPVPAPPVPGPLPPQVASGPLQFTADNQVIENVVIDVAPGQPMTIGLQTSGTTSSVYGKGHKGCILRNVTLRGRQWGALLIDMDDVQLIDVIVTDVNYCGIGIFGGARPQLIRPTVKRVGMLRDGSGNPSIGDAANSYGIKFEAGTAGGGTSGMSSGGLVDHAVIEDVPLWQGINAHAGTNMTIQDCIVRRCPRAYFFAGQVSAFTITGNQALECVTKAGGTLDRKGILVYQMQGATITDNKVSGTYQPGSSVYFDLGGSTGITAARNTVVA